MKKRNFSPKLFHEFMRQLRLPGWIFTAVLAIEAILITAGGVVSNCYRDEAGKLVFSRSAHSFIDIHPFSIFAIYIIAPILTLCALNWVNKRNSSDFYHSLCEKRETVFLSAFAAAVAWTLIALLSSSFIAVVSHAIFPQMFIINYSSVFSVLAVISAGSIFTAACVAVAMSVTGTLFNNIIISGILIFLPSTLVFTIRTVVSNALEIMTTKGVFGHSFIIPFGLFEVLIYGGDILTSIPAALFTLAVAIVYIAVATFLFRSRKSEFAGMSAVGKKTQTIFRVLVGTVFSLLPCGYIFNLIINSKRIGYYVNLVEDLFFITVFYTIVVLAVLIYELIATRKFRNLLTALKSLLYVGAVNIALIAIMFGGNAAVLSFTPDADDINSVQVFVDEGGYNSEYYNAMVSKIKFEGKEIKALVSEALKDNVETIKSNGNVYEYSYSNASTQYTVAINTDFGTRYRKIYLNNKKNDKLMEYLDKNKKYQEIFTTLPEPKDITVNIYSDCELSKEEEAKLYELCRQDYANSDFSEILNSQNGSYAAVYSMDIIAKLDSKSYVLSIPVDETTPRAYNYYMEIMTENNKDKIDEFANELEEYTPESGSDIKTTTVDVCFYNVKNDDGTKFDSPVYNNNIDFKVLAEYVRENGNTAPKAGHPMASVMYSIDGFDEVIINGETDYRYNPDKSKYYFMYIPLDETGLPDFYIPSTTETETETIG